LIVFLEDELYELKEFLPLNINNQYFEKMFQNLLVAKDSNFYNNAVLNLAQFYNYILHCFLVRLYNADNSHLDLLKYLQLTESCLNSNDGKQINICECEKIDIYAFQNKEKDAIKYFFHLLKINSGSHICDKNQRIFDKRNLSAHLSYQVIKIDEFDRFLVLVSENLEEISNKLYKQTKQLIVDDLKKAISKKLITDDDYMTFFELLNQDYLLSINDYKRIKANGYLANIKPNTPKYYLNKYITEDLGLSD
jgi:hypothetical protein